MSTIVWFDFEAGGTELHHPNTQLAAVATRGGDEIGSFEAKIQFPEHAATREALELNHYDPAVWRAEAIPEHAALAGFTAFLEAHADVSLRSKRGRHYKVARVGGHNVVAFDVPRLRDMAARCGSPRPVWLPCCWWYPLDTYQRAIWYYQEHRELEAPENYRLETLARHLGLDAEGAHDALADVRMCAQVARALADRQRAAA